MLEGVALYGAEVSLGLRPRPSLSAVGHVGGAAPDQCRVSLGLRPRPSLSALGSALRADFDLAVSLGLRPRPSLSVQQRVARLGRADHRVAGATAPAFVERQEFGRAPGGGTACVAGATAPAFVERFSMIHRAPDSRGVAGATAPAFVERTATDSALRMATSRCRWGYGSGLR